MAGGPAIAGEAVAQERAATAAEFERLHERVAELEVLLAEANATPGRGRLPRPPIDPLAGRAGHSINAIAASREGLAIYDAEERLVFCNDVYVGLYPALADVLKPGISFETVIRVAIGRGRHPEAAGRRDGHRSPPVASDGPLIEFAHRQVRVIFRYTSYYYKTLHRTLNPEHLQDGVLQSIQLDVLSLLWLKQDARGPLWPIIDVEQRDLVQLDIPRFTAYTNDEGMSLATGQWIEGCFAKPSYEAVRDRLEQLGEEDLDRQVRLIRKSLASEAVAPTMVSSPSEVEAQAFSDG